MRKLTSLLIIGTSLGLASCNLFHQTPEFEMERLSQDVLSQKNPNRGISITVMPVDEPKK